MLDITLGESGPVGKWAILACTRRCTRGNALYETSGRRGAMISNPHGHQLGVTDLSKPNR